MANDRVSNILFAALPTVRGEPLPELPKSLYRYVAKVSGRQQVALSLLTVLIFPLTLVPLELQRRIVDEAIDQGNFQLLAFLGGLYAAALLAQAALKFMRNLYLVRVAEEVTRLLRRRVAHAVSPGDAADTGTKQAIVTSEAEKVGGFIAESIAFPLLQAGVVVSVVTYMFVVEPVMAFVAIGFLVPSIVIVAMTQPALNRLSDAKITLVRELAGDVLGDEQDQREDDEEADRLIERICRLRLRFAAIKHATKALNNLINHLGPLSVFMVGGWLVIEGRTEVGTIVAFISGYERMSNPGRELLNFYRRLAMMHVQYRLVYEAEGPAPSP